MKIHPLMLLLIPVATLPLLAPLALIYQSLYGNHVEHRFVRFDLSSDGREIVFSSADGDLYLLDPVTRQWNRLTETDRIETSPAFSPDGNLIAFAGSDDDGQTFHLFLLDVASRKVVPLTDDDDANDFFPRFHPQGNEIVFARAYTYRSYSLGGMTWDDYDVATVNIDGSNLRRLSNEKYRIVGPLAVRSDGTIEFAATVKHWDNLSEELLTLPPDSPPQPLITKTTPHDRSGEIRFRDPAVSLDESGFAYVADRTDAWHFAICVEQEGAAAKAYEIADSHIQTSPVFAPDNQSIYFLRALTANYQSRPIFSLWKLSLADGQLQEIASDELLTSPENWQPDAANSSERP